MPSISPNTPAASSYTVTGSKAFVANPLLDFNNVPRAFTLTHPDPAPAGLAIVLVRLTAPGGSVDLVSLATAGWTGYQHFRWARPVVKVSGTQWIHGMSWQPDESRAGFSIDVTRTITGGDGRGERRVFRTSYDPVPPDER